MPRPYQFHAIVLRLAAVLSLLLAATTASASDWRWRLPLPQGNRVHAIAYGLDRYVAVGEAGALVTSRDGDTWRQLPPATHAALRAVTFGDGVFVAVGNTGAVIRSVDGEHWETVPSGVTHDLQSVVHGPAGFVAAGGLHLIVSPDGINWNEIDHGVPSGDFPSSFRGLAYGNGRYVALADLGPFEVNPPAKVMTSSDAVNWRLDDFIVPPGFQSGLVFFRDVTFGEGYFVAAAFREGGRPVTFRSVDGVTWEWHRMPQVRLMPTGPLLPLYMKSLTYDAARGRFVGAATLNDPWPYNEGLQWIVESEDGATWTPHPNALVAAPPIHPVRSAHGRLFGFTPHGEIYGSTTADVWTATTMPSPFWNVVDLVSNRSGLMAAGSGPTANPLPPDKMSEGVVMHSVDGVSWNAVAMPTAIGYVFRRTVAVTASESAFVVAAVESIRTRDRWQNVLYVSNDGAAWKRIDVARMGDVSLMSSAGYGAGALLVMAKDSSYGNVVLRSLDDGVNWQRHSVTGPLPGALAYGTAGFVGLPESGIALSPGDPEVLHSVDGLTWTSSPAWNQPGGSLRSVAHSGGVYLIAAQAWDFGVQVDWLLRSTDGGITWQASRFASNSGSITSLSGTDAGFVIGASSGDVLTSKDGLDWSTSWSGASNVSRAVTAADGRLWVSTSTGGILQRSGALGFADIAVATMAAPAIVRPGETMTFQTTVTNHGPSPAILPGVGFALGAEVTDLVVRRPPGWTCDAPTTSNGATSIACMTDALTVDAQAAFAATATAPTSSTHHLVTMTTAATSQTEEPNPVDNSASAGVTIGALADVSSSISGPNTIPRSAAATYDVVIKNAGVDAAAQAEVALEVDVPAANVSIAKQAGWRCTRHITTLYRATCTATAGALPIGSSPPVKLTVSLQGKSFHPLQFTIRARASSQGVDINPSNNASLLTVRRESI
jgi:hypothetical protein